MKLEDVGGAGRSLDDALRLRQHLLDVPAFGISQAHQLGLESACRGGLVPRIGGRLLWPELSTRWQQVVTK